MTALDRIPLARHTVIATGDVDEARASVGRSLCPHRLSLRGDRFGLRHNVVTVGRVGVHYIDYGGHVRVAADGLPFVLVQIPLTGSMTVSSTRCEDVDVTPGRAVVTGVADPVRMSYREGNARLMLRVAPGDLAARSRRLAARPTDPRALSLIDLTTGPGRTLRTLVDLIVADTDEMGPHAPVLADSLGVAVIDALVCATQRTDDDVPVGGVPGARALRRALEVIEARCAEPVSVTDIAADSGLSVRSMQTLFRTHLGTTPAAHIRRTRLEHIRRDLRSGSVTSVTAAAQRWAVPHLGRFSRDYRTAFGELPSETLRSSHRR